MLGGATTATACKVAAVVCATAITAGGAVEVRKLATDPAPQRERTAAQAAPDRTPAAQPAPAPAAVQPYRADTAPAAHPARPAAAPRREHAAAGERARRAERTLVAPPPEPAPYVGHDDPPVSVGGSPQVSSGGTEGPAEEPAGSGVATEQSAGTAPVQEPAAPVEDPPVAEPSTPAPAVPEPGGTTPPPEH